MSESSDEFVDVRIELPLPLDVLSTLMQVIELTYPGTMIRGGKGEWRSENRLVLAIPTVERHKSAKKAEKYAKAKAHLDGHADATINQLSPGGVPVGLPAYVSRLLVAMCQAQFAAYPDAENYLESTVYDRENNTSYVIICARSEKQTPHALRMKAEAEVERLRAELKAMQEVTNQVPTEGNPS